MPALRTRDTQSKSLEVMTDAPQPPTLSIISPTPRAFTFPPPHPPSNSPYSSPSHSPFEPDLFSFPCTTAQDPRSLSPDSVLRPTTPIQSSQVQQHKRRKSSLSDVERRPRKGDDDYVKRPENAFILFRRKCCEDRQQEETAADAPIKKQRQADLSKTISQQWKSLSQEERQYWEQLAKEKKKEHEQMYPNYVYRPQRSKEKVKSKKNIKGRRPEHEHEVDGESLSFVLPMAPPRHHGRSVSAPTPPPHYQSVQIPNVFHMTPSCPTSPSLLPMISRRSTLTGLEDLSACLPDDNLLAPTQSFEQAGQYDALTTNDYLRNMYPAPSQSSLPGPEQQGLHALTIPHENFLLPQAQLISPTSSLPSAGLTAASPSSPDTIIPFSPTSGGLTHSFAQLTMPSNDQPHLSDPQLTLDLPVDFQLPQSDMSNYTWESNDIWSSSGEALLTNDDFDLRAIPPIELELPKCPEDVSFNTTSGLGFGQDFTQALDGQQFNHDGRHLDNLYLFEEMMAGHGF